MGRRLRLLCGMVAEAGYRRLTSLHVVWWLINKCAHPVEWLGCCSSLSRGISSESEFPPCRGPAEGSAEGGLERGGDCPHYEGPRQRALERGGACATAEEPSEEPYRSVGPWAGRAFWASST